MSTRERYPPGCNPEAKNLFNTESIRSVNSVVASDALGNVTGMMLSAVDHPLASR